jgi:hypothetical protein
MLFEFVEQRVHLQRRKTVSGRVRQDGVAARATDPCDCLAEGDPPMGDVTALAGPQVLFERGFGVGGMALLHQEAGEVAAAYDGCVAGEPRGTSQTVRDTRGVKLLRDLFGTKAARHANPCQAMGKRCIARLYAESDHMYGQAGPSDRNFDSRHEDDAGIASRRRCLRQPADFVMVGEREHGDPVVRRALDQRCGSQHSIGIRGVAV